MSGRSRHATETFGLLNFPVSFFSLAWHGFLYWLCHDFTCMYRMPIKCHKTVLIPHHGEGFPCARLSICKYACIVAIKCRFDDWLNFWKDFIWKFSIIKFSITTIMTLCKLAHEELQLALFFFLSGLELQQASTAKRTTRKFWCTQAPCDEPGWKTTSKL